MVNITLKEIIKRKIQFDLNDSDEELIETNAGYIRGYNQMLADMDLTEDDFVDKYSKIIRGLDLENPNENIDELCGYNNAIVNILSLLDEKYLYEDI